KHDDRPPEVGERSAGPGKNGEELPFGRLPESSHGANGTGRSSIRLGRMSPTVPATGADDPPVPWRNGHSEEINETGRHHERAGRARDRARDRRQDHLDESPEVPPRPPAARARR